MCARKRKELSTFANYPFLARLPCMTDVSLRAQCAVNELLGLCKAQSWGFHLDARVCMGPCCAHHYLVFGSYYVSAVCTMTPHTHLNLLVQAFDKESDRAIQMLHCGRVCLGGECWWACHAGWSRSARIVPNLPLRSRLRFSAKDSLTASIFLL